VLRHPVIAKIAARAGCGPAQIVFSFARAIGILPLTGTSDAEHMKQDLDSLEITLSGEEVNAIVSSEF
jgi:diketogulonate reductase-like aldo/keto reductase